MEPVPGLSFGSVPDGLISDEDAAILERDLPTLKGATYYLAASKLNEYNAFRSVYPRPLTEGEQRQREEQYQRLEALYENFDVATQGQEFESLKWAPAAEHPQIKANLSAQAFVKWHLGKTWDEPEWSSKRDALADRLFRGEGKGSDTAFVARGKRWLADQKDERDQITAYRSSGIKSALRMRPGDPMAEAAKVEAEAPLYGKAWREARMQMEAKASPLRPVAREIEGLLSAGKTERFGDEAQKAMETAIDKLAELPEDQRALVVAMLQNEQTGADSTGNMVEKGVSAGIRGFTGQLRGFASNEERQRIMRVMDALTNENTTVPAGTTSDQLYSTLRGIAGNSSDPQAGPAQAIASIFTPTRKLTEDERKQVKAQADKALTRNEVAQQAIAILEGRIDPIKHEGSLLNKVAIGTGGSIGAMVPAFLPYAGLFIQQGAFADQEYQRQRQLGTDPQTAHAVSQFTGTVQAGLDRVQAIFALKLPGLSAAAPVAGNMWLRVPGAIGAVQAAEYTVEKAQDFVPALTAALAGPLGFNLPEQAQFTEELKRWKFLDTEMYLTLLPLSLFGGGYQGISSTIQGRQELARIMADATNMEAVGIPKAEAERIAALPEAERPAAYKAAYPQRDPSTEGAGAAQKAVAERVKAEMAQGQAAVQELGQAGLSIERTDEGFTVIDTESGDRITAPDATEAMTIARGIMLERGMQREETFLDALGEFAGIMQPGRTIEISDRSGSLLAELEAATAEGREQNIGEIWDRADDYRASQGEEALARDIENPDSRNALEGMLVLGRSRTIAEQNAARSISLIMQGGGTLDIVEEQAENDLREAVIAGRTSLATMRRILKRIEAATGDKYILSETQVGITEAWARLVRLYTTGTKKGNAITSGARKETAAELRGYRAQDRAERRRLREAEAAGVTPSAFSKAREYLAQVRAMLRQVARLMKARAEGKLDDVEAMIRESVGLKEQDAHEAEVTEAVPIEYNLPDGWETDDVGFSIQSRAQPADTSRRVVMPDGAELIGPTSFSIRAYHGTPHKVDKFRMDKIGTGEGAQAYGWGLYFAAALEVAKKYMPRDEKQEDKLMSEYKRVETRQDYEAMAFWEDAMLNKTRAELAEYHGDQPSFEQWLERWDAISKTAKSRLYTVELLPDEADFLDWDKPLREQSEKVKAALGSFAQLDRNLTSLQGRIKNKAGKPADTEKELSLALLELGIPGIRYLDGNSRDGGEGTHNYVIFDEDLVRILEENGKPVEGGTSFSITTADRLETVAAALSRKARDPEARFRMFDQARENLAGMARAVRYNDSVAGAVSATEVERQRKARKRATLERLYEEIETDFGDLSGTEFISKATNNPVIEALINPGKGKSGLPRGRLKTRTMDLPGGEYDGSETTPRWLFGGTLTPDLAAQELYEAGLLKEPSTDAMWTAIDSALQTTAGAKDRLEKYAERRREARETAAAEAQAWADEEMKKVPTRSDAAKRGDMLRFLSALDTILMPFPPEVRAKVGGFVKLAGLRTNASMETYLHDRVEKLDAALEDYLQTEYRKAIAQIFERSEVKRGENRIPKGKLTAGTQAEIDKAKAFASLTLTQAEAQTAAAEAILATPTTDQIALDAATEDMLLLHLFGGALDETKGGKSATELAEAFRWLQDAYTKGRSGNAVLREELKKRWDDWRTSITTKLGPATSDEATARINKDKGANPMAFAAQMIDGLHDIHQQLKDLLGEKHPVTQHFSEKIRQARQKARWEIHSEGLALFDWMRDNLGIKSKARQAIALAEVSRQVESPVFRVVGRKTVTDEISPDLARQILDGTVKDDRYLPLSDSFKALGEALAQWAEGKSNTATIAVGRVTDPGTRTQRTMSMMDAINDTLLWQQPRYRESNMERHGLGADYIAQVEKWLSPTAKSIRDFIRARYGIEYDGMNQTFRTLFNVNMPREENYARAGFEVAGMTAEATGPDGLPMSPSGISIGSIKGRIAHKAEPKRQNALAVRMSHVGQIAHWKAAAEVARDLRAVFSPVEVRNSIIAKEGEATYKRLMVAIQTFEAGGWREAMSNMDGHEMAQSLFSTGVANSLGGNIGSILAQVPAAIVGMTRLGPVTWTKAAARLVANPSLIADIYQDNALKLRRGPVFSRGQVFSMLTGKNRNIVAQQIVRIGEMGTEILGDADAALTAINGAVAYLGHLADLEGVMPERAAKELALDRMRQTIEESAQPDDFTRKSNLENRIAASTGLMMLPIRGVFLFKSAARALSSNIFLTLKQASSGDISPTTAAGRLAAMLIVIPLIEQTMRSLWRDMTSDDSDDELWRKPATWIAAMASAPLSGMPLMGTLQDIAKVELIGGFTVTVQDPATRLVSETLTATRKVVKDGEIGLDAVTAASHLTALGLSAYGLPGGLLIETALNLTKAGSGVMENLETTDEEKDEKYRKSQAEAAKRKAKAQAKKEAKQ